MEEKKPKNRLELSTKKSLYDPTEVVIDGKTYYSLKTTHAVMKELDKIDEEVGKNRENRDALYKAVQLLFGIDMEVLKELDAKEVEDIYVFSKKQILEIEKMRLELARISFGADFDVEKAQVKKVIRKNQKRSGKKR